MIHMNVWGWMVIAWFIANIIVSSFKSGRPVKERDAWDTQTATAAILSYIVLYGILIWFVFLAVSTK